MPEATKIHKLDKKAKFYYPNSGRLIIAEHFKFDVFDGALFGYPCAADGTTMQKHEYPMIYATKDEWNGNLDDVNVPTGREMDWEPNSEPVVTFDLTEFN